MHRISTSLSQAPWSWQGWRRSGWRHSHDAPGDRIWDNERSIASPREIGGFFRAGPQKGSCIARGLRCEGRGQNAPGDRLRVKLSTQINLLIRTLAPADLLPPSVRGMHWDELQFLPMT